MSVNESEVKVVVIIYVHCVHDPTGRQRVQMLIPGIWKEFMMVGVNSKNGLVKRDTPYSILAISVKPEDGIIG